MDDGPILSAIASPAPGKSRERHADAANRRSPPANDTPRADGERPGRSAIDPPSALMLFVAAIGLLIGGYGTIFALSLDVGPAKAFRIAIGNVAPLAALAAAAWWSLRRWVLGWSVVGQTATHVVLAPLFAATWYGCTLVALATGDALGGERFAVRPFGPLAFTWQMFQGVVLYALVAAVTYALRGGRRAAQVALIERAAPIERYLTRTGDELVPIAVDDISFIRGAQDYAEVMLRDGRAHLVRLSLGEFSARLPAGRFLRVHRSTIVNLAHLVRAEPLGSGRMALHMPGGTVEASRAGTQALRERIL